MDPTEFAGKIDHTLLSKNQSLGDLDGLLDMARKHGMNVCVPPSRVGYVADKFGEGEIVSVVGFPLGYNSTEVKQSEAELVVEAGATEIDVACNLGYLESGEEEEFRSDVEQVVDVVDVPVKAVIESGLLDEEGVRRASRLLVEAGVDYVKTCTGFVGGGVKVKDVEWIRDEVGEGVGVKASGGIRNWKAALRLLESGADRIGSSRGDDLVRGYLENQ